MFTLILISLAALALVLFGTAWAKGFGRYTRRQRAHPLLARFAAVCVLCAGFLSALRCAFCATPSEYALANLGAESWGGSKRFLTDAAVATRYLLGKKGSDIDHIAICGAADEPYVVITDEATAAEKEVTGEFLSIAQRTLPMVASEAITIGDDVYTAANGKVQDEPAVAGTYYKVGTAVTAAAADGDAFSVLPCAPIKVVVIAALGNANNEIGALAISAAYSQAEVQALRAACEELADDVRAIAGALATPALVKVLT